jgi:hypothetical protein
MFSTYKGGGSKSPFKPQYSSRTNEIGKTYNNFASVEKNKYHKIKLSANSNDLKKLINPVSTKTNSVNNFYQTKSSISKFELTKKQQVKK